MILNNVVADMHTHSQHSHDSVCPIEEMCISQIEKCTKIFAVTDHCDVFSFKHYDIFTPIKVAYEEVKLLNEKYGKECLLLSGVEISEGFWFPQEYKKIHDLVPFDVIIGSVHCVKHPKYNMAYSKIDFSAFSKEEIYDYLDCYFDDMITMINETDFDILAHLTCPIRYITSKYGIEIDIRMFEEKINRILTLIIEKNIALEINTSGFSILNDTIPSNDIVSKYYALGGRLITIGSDAHIKENASMNFGAVIEEIKKIGFENICYYKDRKVNKINI